MNDLFSVKGKVVLVTGAAHGNGKAIADGFVAYDAIVFFADKLEQVVTTVANTGSKNAHAVVCDLYNNCAIERIVSAVVEKCGRIDVLVNNAGVSISQKEPYSEEVWDKTFSVNLKAAFLLSSKVAGIMMKQGNGSIINITSLGAELGFPNNPSYVASKGGLKQLTKAMARDLAKFNIRVNNVCPGYIKTAMTKNSYNDPALREKRNRRIMLDRWGEPNDLVGPCIFLASEASAYITGIDLLVDGGWLAKGL